MSRASTRPRRAEDARAAIEAAREAFPAWAALPAGQRAVFFTKRPRRDRGARRAGRAGHDGGDGQAAARGPARNAAGGARSSATAAGEACRPIGEMYEPSVADQRLFTLRRPLGVVGLITPWNFPIAIPVWKLAPALIYGNTLVLKLGYEAPRTGLHVAECFAEAGLPAGVLNVLDGLAARKSARRSSRTRVCARSRSRAPCRSAAPCATRRPRATAASSSSSAGTTR